jgi:FkbM family methyltransferase
MMLRRLKKRKINKSASKKILMTFKLEDFEYAAYSRKHEDAARMLVNLLSILDSSYGVPGHQFQAQPLVGIAPDQREAHIGIRLASAISCLFSDKEFHFAPQSLTSLFTLQRWFATIFGSTNFLNADHVVRALNLAGKGNLSHLEVSPQDLPKFCLLYLPESEIVLEIDALWDANKNLAASLGLALLSPRFLGSPHAHQKREALLPWLTEKLPEIEALDILPFGIMHDVYMHCSYADQADKHVIKGAINVLIERWLNQHNLLPLDAAVNIPKDDSKPVMLVVMEWFNAGHSIYRTHSRTLEAARELFHVVGMGLANATDAVGHAVFDEWIEIKPASLQDQIAQIRQVASDRQAQVFYMPSVGMFPLTMMLTNIRLAPVMAMALGHPATTHSSSMDYVVVEEDYVGDPDCFSEELLILPSDGMPYRPSGLASQNPEPPVIRENPEVVDIVVAASAMKINPGFLSACKEIATRSRVPVKFHFAVAFAQGMVYEQVKRVISNVLGDQAIVYSHRGYAEYMQIVHKCDMFINPFPFGNTNGIIDTVTAGLVGVCKTGMEVNEHIDQGLFERFGLPNWLVATDTENYIKATLKLAENHELRNELRRKHAGPDKVEKIFHGRPEIMGQMLMERLLKASNKIEKKPRDDVKRKTSIPDWLKREVDDYFSSPIDVEPKTVLDIGANIGAFALRAHQEWPKAKIACYEPIASNVEKLRMNVDAKWCQIEPYGVRAASGKEPIYIGDIFVTASFIKGARQTSDAVEVDCIAAADLPSYDLVKIDTEGCELEILQNLNLSKTQVIMLEHHCLSDAQVIKQLLSEHFVMIHGQTDLEVGTEVFVRK